MGRRSRLGARASLLRALAPYAALALPMLGASTGCSLVSALANPSAGWAIGEPAPMTVVVRRAEVARETARQVDRLLSETGVNGKSKWTSKTQMTSSEGEASLKSVGGEPAYAGAQVRVVPAEAWLDRLSSICSTEEQFPSLLAAISEDVGNAYSDISEQNGKLAQLKASVAKEEAALDDKATPAGEKGQHEKEKARLGEEIEKLSASYAPKVAAFLEKVKADAGKAPGPIKERVGGALGGLRRAVGDARNANAAALLRYPLAVPKLVDDLQVSAKRFVADVIEEKSGHRPDMKSFKPDVKLEGLDVQFTLAGLPPEALASLEPADVLKEVTVRARNYVEMVVTLTAFAAETQETLGLEGDVIDAALQGFAVEPGKSGGESLSELKVQVTAGAKPPKAKDGAGARTPGGIRAASCDKPAAPVEEAAAEPEPDPAPDKAAGKGGKAGAKAGAKGAARAAASAKGTGTTPAAPAAPTPPRPKGRPAAAPAPAANGGASQDCSVSVMRGNQKICL